MAHVLGIDAKLYYNTATYGTPTWVEIANVREVTLSLEKNEADVTTRAAAGWRQTAVVLKDASIEFEMIWDTTDAAFTAVKDAFINNTQIDVFAVDGAEGVAGNEGLRAEMEVISFSRNESLEEALTVSVSLKPGFSSNAPTWLVTS